jgi:hypothetical protein
MSAGPGTIKHVLVVDGMKEADLRTALEIQKATTRAWEGIAAARAQTIHHLQAALDRYQRRSSN